MTERQNDQIKTMMEHIEAPSKLKNKSSADSIARRKVAKRDTTSSTQAEPMQTSSSTPITPQMLAAPRVTQAMTQNIQKDTTAVAMEEEKAETAIPATLDTVIAMLTKISNQVNDLTRMGNVETKCGQLTVRIMTLEAKFKHRAMTTKRAAKEQIRLKRRGVSSARKYTIQPTESEE